MKTVCFVLGALALLTADARAQDKPADLKVVTDQLEKAFGLKFKSIVVADRTLAPAPEMVLTFEFTKDLPDKKALKEAFAATGKKPDKLDKHVLVFHLFDADNVSLTKYGIVSVEGELSGVKGDAFRVLIYYDRDALKKAKKLEARLQDAQKEPEPKKN